MYFLKKKKQGKIKEKKTAVLQALDDIIDNSNCPVNALLDDFAAMALIPVSLKLLTLSVRL